MRAGEETGNQLPFEFARRRFAHACYELMNTDRNIYERLLDALVALAPLNTESLPESCRSSYEQVQQLIGSELWSDAATSGTLAPAIRALSSQQASIAAQLIFVAGDTLDFHCASSQAGTPYRSSEATTVIRQNDDSVPEVPNTRTFYLT